MFRYACALGAVLMAGIAQADEAEDAFVEANILGIFYHELGHALIDVMQMPVFGQEEDAADVASILLIDSLFEPDRALQMAYDVADGFWAEAQQNGIEDVPYWDVHGPDPQRYYNTVCLFYGGDPDTRDGFAEDMELPEDRAETCPDEYELAAASWGAVFDEMSSQPGARLGFEARDGKTFTARVIGAEVDALNADFALPEQVVVITESCGEANAYYYPSEWSIVVCEEFEGYLRELYGMLTN